MLGGLAVAGAKALGGTRFSLINIMPAAILVGFVTLLAASGLYSAEANPKFDEATSKIVDHPGVAVLVVFGIFVMAVLLRPFQVALVHVLEGYWLRLPVLNGLTAVAVERHRRIRHTAGVIEDATSADLPVPANPDLANVANWQRGQRRRLAYHHAAEALGAQYPVPRKAGDVVDDRLMPTLLGNALRRGEDNAGDRYALTMQVVWPRMYPKLSPKLETAISRSLDLLDASAALCISFAAAALSSVPLVRRWDIWSLVPFVIAAISLLAYRGAIRVAHSHAALLATGIDLHRFDLLAALHLELPKTPEAERDLNTKLSTFLADPTSSAVDVLKGIEYDHPKETGQTLQVEVAPGSEDAGSGE